MMDAPQPELFEQPGSLMVDPGKTPMSVAGVEGEKDRLETVGVFDDGMGWGYDDYGGLDDMNDMNDMDVQLPSPATPENQQSKKKKKLQLDDDIVLDDDEVKRLLRNRASLVKTRGGESGVETDGRKRLVSVSFDEDYGWLFVEAKKKKIVSEVEKPVAVDDQHQPFQQDDFGYDDYGGGDDYFEDPLMGAMPLTPVQDVMLDNTMPADGFTARTQSVLKQMRERGTRVSLNELVENKTRLEACRWFFESLVLRNKGYVDLEQAKPYGDIEIVLK
jgi:hypothetical protein